MDMTEDRKIDTESNTIVQLRKCGSELEQPQ